VKVLWLSNYRFTDKDIKTTGTWLKVMGESLSKENGIELVNITKGQSKGIVIEHINGIRQYVVPSGNSYTNDLPKPQIVSQIEDIIEKEHPDIIHVWGTESYWGLITKNFVQRFIVLLEIQGILSQIKQQFYGGLTHNEILRCTGFKEFVKPNTHLLYQYYIYKRLAQNEQEVICSHHLISVQSEWSKRSIVGINSKAKIFNALIPLREEFVMASGTWSHQSSRKIFTSAAGVHSYKGLHIAFRALNILLKNGVNASLNIAGAQSKGIRQSGYKLYLLSLIKSLELESHVNWLGALNASEIIRELQTSDVVLIPSYMESYCMVLYESLSIGIPIVCTYAGAMPEAGQLNHEIKYFQPGDYLDASFLLADILTKERQVNFANIPVVTAKAAVERQLEIYNEIISS
jgi:glycosyltransferase involved in cell wall biosynthesis